MQPNSCFCGQPSKHSDGSCTPCFDVKVKAWQTANPNPVRKSPTKPLKPRPSTRKCAICDQTNLTTHICDECLNDPINSGWQETPSEEIQVDPHAFECESFPEVLPPGTSADNEDTRRILQLAVFGRLVSYEEFSAGAIKKAKRIPAMPLRQIMAELGVTYWAAQSTVKKYLKNRKY